MTAEIYHIPAPLRPGGRGEYLPATEEWGRHGWTFGTLREARDRLNAISDTPHQKRCSVAIASLDLPEMPEPGKVSPLLDR